ncbi:hypothetical protein HanIR_Chr11g0512201 [Helianthus annuus]|nr:hypothetical protein HanIR_Chr11g0512201 [Helianthus annuus]
MVRIVFIHCCFDSLNTSSSLIPLRRPLVYNLLYSSENRFTTGFIFRHFEDIESRSRYGPCSIISRNFDNTAFQNPSPVWLLPIFNKSIY